MNLGDVQKRHAKIANFLRGEVVTVGTGVGGIRSFPANDSITLGKPMALQLYANAEAFVSIDHPTMGARDGLMVPTDTPTVISVGTFNTLNFRAPAATSMHLSWYIFGGG